MMVSYSTFEEEKRYENHGYKLQTTVKCRINFRQDFFLQILPTFSRAKLHIASSIDKNRVFFCWHFGLIFHETPCCLRVVQRPRRRLQPHKKKSQCTIFENSAAWSSSSLVVKSLSRSNERMRKNIVFVGRGRAAAAAVGQRLKGVGNNSFRPPGGASIQ